MANPDFIIKANDTWPPLDATLTDATGAIDLTSATGVKLLMKSPEFLVSGDCTVEDAAAGQVRYTWEVGDTANGGDYDTEFEITWNTGRVETVPNDGYKLVRIEDDLG